MKKKRHCRIAEMGTALLVAELMLVRGLEPALHRGFAAISAGTFAKVPTTPTEEDFPSTMYELSGTK
jgi:hypothetical protein